MIVAINDPITIKGTRQGNEIHFYGSDAYTVKEHAPSYVKVREERGYLGICRKIDLSDLDLLSPRLVAKGYKLQIENW